MYGAIRKIQPSASEEVAAKLETVETGGTVSVEIKKNEIITADVFEKARDKKATIVIETSNGAVWTIKGSDITGTSLKDIDFTVEKVENVIPNNAISEVALDGEKIELSLAHTGEFGFKAELKLNLDSKNKDKYANLFYYNPNTGKLEFMQSVKIDKDGLAGFEYTHASDYAIIISENKYEVVTDNGDTDSKTQVKAPLTGDTTNVSSIIIVMLLSISVFGAIFIKKRAYK